MRARTEPLTVVARRYPWWQADTAIDGGRLDVALHFVDLNAPFTVCATSATPAGT
jgi:hypothetical protein